MNIAIADDLAADRQIAEEQLHRYVSESYPDIVDDFSLDTFACAEDLLENFSPGKYDLLVLDIFMADMTGMEAAEAIRLQDEKVPIIFLTTSQDYILEGYRVFAAGYLLKPLTDHLAEFSHTMEHVFHQLMDGEKSLSATVNGEEVNIPFRKIVYVDINAHHRLSIHLLDSELDTNLAYVNCQEILLLRRNFVECHHRIIINMDYVKKMDKAGFALHNGIQIPISQRRQKEVKAAYMRYLVHR